MTDLIFTIGDALLIIAAAGAAVFAVSYATFFDWRKTSAGRALLYFVVSLIVVFLNNTAARLIGADYAYREWVRLAVYLSVALTVWHLVQVLWANWRTDRPPLDIPTREPNRKKENQS